MKSDGQTAVNEAVRRFINHLDAIEQYYNITVDKAEWECTMLRGFTYVVGVKRDHNAST